VPASAVPAPASPVVRALARLATHLAEDFLGGPRPFRMAWVINAQKATTALFVGALMIVYRNGSTAAWVYLALHGTYGLLWLTKHFAFPDRRWERRVTVGGAVMTWLGVLGLYWVIAFLAVSDVLGPRPAPAPALLGGAVALHTFGAALMMAADAQKHFTLRLRPGLIEVGLFARIRYPNYLGEMMLYGAYALLARHWLAWVILVWAWGMVFVPNMLMSDASLSRHPGFAAYRARTGLLLPRLAPLRRRAEPSSA
jgi:protein-S-isoprenylcysteine O-methyltransferase Ste14